MQDLHIHTHYLPPFERGSFDGQDNTGVSTHPTSHGDGCLMSVCWPVSRAGARVSTPEPETEPRVPTVTGPRTQEKLLRV